MQFASRDFSQPNIWRARHWRVCGGASGLSLPNQWNRFRITADRRAPCCEESREHQAGRPFHSTAAYSARACDDHDRILVRERWAGATGHAVDGEFVCSREVWIWALRGLAGVGDAAVRNYDRVACTCIAKCLGHYDYVRSELSRRSPDCPACNRAGLPDSWRVALGVLGEKNCDERP